jgi:undecaprenyl-diphosphatase
MLDWIIYIDEKIFYFLNQVIANPVFDKLMPFITESDHWILLYISALSLLLWKGGKKERWFVLILLVSVVAANHINSDILKDIFGRLRPCKALEDVRLLINCGSGKSFPSSHAVNNFAAAFIIARYYKQYSAIAYTIAGIIAFSRVYNGVHYPVDILAGAFTGILIAFIIAKLFEIFLKKHLIQSPDHRQSE